MGQTGKIIKLKSNYINDLINKLNIPVKRKMSEVIKDQLYAIWDVLYI